MEHIDHALGFESMVAEESSPELRSQLESRGQGLIASWSAEIARDWRRRRLGLNRPKRARRTDIDRIAPSCQSTHRALIGRFTNAAHFEQRRGVDRDRSLEVSWASGIENP
jgi:hypothetical protein